jgi:hypothetical protein
VEEINQRGVVRVDIAGGAVAKHHRGMLNHQTPAISELNDKRPKRLAVQVVPEAGFEFIFTHDILQMKYNATSELSQSHFLAAPNLAIAGFVPVAMVRYTPNTTGWQA